VVDVVDEPQRNAALVGVRERALDDRGKLGREVDVVDRDLEGLLRGADEVGERVRDVVGLLAAVRQRADFDRDLSSALCARLAAW
jgi:hypothetical protein